MLSKKMYDYLNERKFVSDDDKKLVFSYEELSGYYEQMKDIFSNTEILEDIEEDILDMVELYCMYYGILSLTIMPRVGDEKFKELVLVSSIFSTIANSVMSVYYLTIRGFEYQANVVMRQLFELCMILLNISIDEDKAKILMSTEMTEENMKVWRKNFSPKALNDTIDKYEGLDIDMTDWRKGKYSEYSNYTHNQFLSFWLYSYSRAKNKNDIMKLNIWGSYVSRGNSILVSMIDFLWYTNKVFINILCNKDSYIYKLNLINNIDLWNFSMYLFCILDEYYVYYLEKKED